MSEPTDPWHGNAVRSVSSLKMSDDVLVMVPGYVSLKVTPVRVAALRMAPDTQRRPPFDVGFRVCAVAMLLLPSSSTAAFRVTTRL